MKRIQNVFLITIALFVVSCQNIKEYNNCLIEKSVVSEVPTLMGNIIGGVCGVPFLLLSVPAGYMVHENTESRNNFMISPVRFGSYGGGVVLGTPFFPFALLAPRETKTKETNAGETKTNE